MKPIERMTESEYHELVKRAVALPSAPAELIRRAVDAWQAAQPSPLQAAARQALRRVAAVLSFDSWGASPVAYGVRSAAQDVRHLLFSADGRDIDLRLVPRDGRFALAGQVLGPDGWGVAELTAQPGKAGEAGPLRAVALDDMGEFHMDGIERGRYVLTLRLGVDEIELPPIDVGATAP
jgi:hypothetical protein